MPKCKLFDNWTWNGKYLPPFDTVSSTNFTDVHSQHNKQSPAKASLHPYLLAAIQAYMEMDTSVTPSTTSKCAIGTQGNDITVCEYISRSGSIHVVSFNKIQRKFNAGCFADPTSTPTAYTLKMGGNTGTALFFVLIPEAMTDPEFADAYNTLSVMKQNGYPDLEAASKTAALLCDNLYRRITYPDQAGSYGLGLTLPQTNNIHQITNLNLKNGVYSPTSVLHGEFQILKSSGATSAVTVSMTNKDFAGHYTFSKRTFSLREQKLIPAIPEWYILPPEVECICKHAQMTTNSSHPMRNFMLRGPAGTGKTVGAQIIAAGMNLPYLFTTCSANSEIFDLLGQMMPDTKEQSGFISYPTLEDIQMDPPSAYYKLTGEYQEDITDAEVYEMLLKTAELNASQNQTSGSHFRYVDTPLVEAIRNGYLIEIQEPTVISNPGVMVGLNSLLDGCGSIVLPTGEVIKRHPDTVVVITTNTGYAGCRDMNQSIISRMDLILDVPEPSLSVLVERTSKITGCTDVTSITEMAQALQAITRFCKESMITDGCSGMRELISWVQSFMICGNIRQAASYTILPSVSADEENRAAVANACLDQLFAA